MHLSQVVDEQVQFIISHQLPSGAIPWYHGGITDPWDHVECAIALDLAGRHDEARKAYRWLKNLQNPDGSWYSSYVDDVAQDMARDSNFSSYIASGLWYHYLMTRDAGFLSQLWPTVERAIDFALTLQQPTGEVYWAYGASGRPWQGALLAGSCCVWGSVTNAVSVGEVLGFGRPDWQLAADRLRQAIRERPELFDRFGEDSQRFGTSWFYPVLTGVIEGDEGRARIMQGWDEFVVDGWGCKCVSTAPWVTTAETCELVMSLSRLGEPDRAGLLLEWIFRLYEPSGGFRTGVKLPEEVTWPEEKNTWTSASVVIASKALAGLKAEGHD